MQTIRAVVFDWAGTMIDFGCQAPVEALIGAFAGEGVTIPATVARLDMGRAKRDHVRALLARPEVVEAWRSARGVSPVDADGERIYRALEPLMARAAGRFADLIPGAADVTAGLEAKGVKVGSCTGYTQTMMAEIRPRAAAQGYSPKVVVCAGDTPSGRPSPLMLWQALIALDAWPADRCVKVDDAEVGVGEGRSAGCWTVGVAASGNGVGLSLEAYRRLDEGERRKRVAASARSLEGAGAHLVIDTVADLPTGLDLIETWIAEGRRP